MISFTMVTVALACVQAGQALPSHHEGGGQALQGIPGIESYGKINFPKFDLIELGEYSKGELPPKVIHITKEVTVHVPKPYPVKVPHSVPVPYPVAKPYPVVHTKIVKVPQPFPYQIIKKVPIPIEVPKPYPVPVQEHNSGGGGHNFGQSFGSEDYHNEDTQSFGHSFNEGPEENHVQQIGQEYGVPGQAHGSPLGADDYANSKNFKVTSYQSNGYESQSTYGQQPQENDHEAFASNEASQNNNGGWSPSQGNSKHDIQ